MRPELLGPRSRAMVLTEAHYVDADTRVRRRLVELPCSDEGAGAATIPLTQEALAELAGNSPATVNRVMREEHRRAQGFALNAKTPTGTVTLDMVIGVRGGKRRPARVTAVPHLEGVTLDQV